MSTEKIGQKKFTREEINVAVHDAETVFKRIGEEKKHLWEIFEACPPAKSIFRFSRLMDSIEQGEHFGHFGKAINRAERLGRIRKATEEETKAILEAIKAKKQFPFLAVAYRRVWYAATKPELKSSQAMMLNLRDLYHRAKKNQEGQEPTEN